jgi:hypothetical protein
MSYQKAEILQIAEKNDRAITISSQKNVYSNFSYPFVHYNAGKCLTFREKKCITFRQILFNDGICIILTELWTFLKLVLNVRSVLL